MIERGSIRCGVMICLGSLFCTNRRDTHLDTLRPTLGTFVVLFGFTFSLDSLANASARMKE